MKKIIPILFIVLWAVGMSAWFLPNPQSYAVLVRALNEQGQLKWSGSGCFIRKNLILTAGHIVRDTKQFEIVLSNGRVRPGYFEYREDPNLTDVGFIRVQGKYPVSRFGKNPRLGQDVWISGYGLAKTPLTLTKGIISQTNRDGGFFGKLNFLQVDAAAWPGCSGSPVLNSKNQIIGIYVGFQMGQECWGYCVPVNIIRASLKKYDATRALCALQK